MLVERLTPTEGPQPSFSVSTGPQVACFSITARADASVMPRVLELFAKRGLIPSRWHSDLSGRRRDELLIDLQVEGLDRDKADLIAHAMRQIVPVVSVLTSEKSYA